MSDTTTTLGAPGPGDRRRAAALMLQHVRRDPDGVADVLTDVLADTAEADAPGQLIMALLYLTEAAQPQLRTDEGQAWLRQVVADYACDES